MRPLNRPAATIAASIITLTLAGCSGGNSIEGTYFGTAGHTVLILESDGQCAYTEGYDEGEDVQLEIDEDCSWSLSGTDLTLIGVSRHGSLTASVGDDGRLSIPDQHRWNGEIYSKE
jgi:hypothetical protein